MFRSKGRIVDFFSQTTQYMTPIKGQAGQKYSVEGGGYINKAGAFMSFPEPHLYMKIFVYETNKCSSVDVREYVLDANPSWGKITQNRINALKENLCGLKIKLESDDYSCWEPEDYDDIDFEC